MGGRAPALPGRAAGQVAEAAVPVPDLLFPEAIVLAPGAGPADPRFAAAVLAAVGLALEYARTGSELAGRVLELSSTTRP
ncbi:hypothetical protein [Streptomyces sp. CBMA156]|uniref:hypothetical protein n=1 Tax=Streptomyces sp. CBMA156 TaxID=1930280 RepID=UPI001661A329|nr:hypothetical protein [Streptomyces sp. CBMA156]MBD0675657.1 hypothetical protein [Streptomyces sp. CBMA156]